MCNMKYNPNQTNKQTAKTPYENKIKQNKTHRGKRKTVMRLESPEKGSGNWVQTPQAKAQTHP